jgi:hypothetical protein
MVSTVSAFVAVAVAASIRYRTRTVVCHPINNNKQGSFRSTKQANKSVYYEPPHYRPEPEESVT